MESFPYFFRIRAITFTCIMLFSFLWLVLLCVEMFTRWSTSDQITQSLMVVLILANATTLLTLPVLMLVQFRIWLDAARLLLLFVLQFGSACASSVWSPRIQCPDETPDDFGVCQLIVAYTMIACWVIPVILALYSTYFAIVVYLQSRIPVVVESKQQNHLLGTDLESGSTGSFSSWNETLKNIVSVQATNAGNVPPRPLVLPTLVHIRQSSLSQSSASQRQPTLPNAPRHQSMLPSLPHNGQKPIPTLPLVPNRHNSLPAIQHDNVPHVRPVLPFSMPHPLIADTPSCPQTPSANPLSRSFSFVPSAPDIQSPGDHFGTSRHLSTIPLSSSPRMMRSTERRLTPSLTQAKLSKLPPPLM